LESLINYEKSRILKLNTIKGSDFFFTDEKIFLIDFFPNNQTNHIRLSDNMKKKLRQGKEEDENLLSKRVPKKIRGCIRH